ncbi:hypothetical protein [Anaerosporobacter sp.]|uniref:hypothetical protein n=1 Tax=Anaerosporobacter sp. TaxID=1872529 RepID=UPI00286EB760|nr:hypothetical protein [Anaerosporobacter sp.]
MDAITNLLELDIISVLFGVFIIITATVSIATVIGKLSEVIGKPVKWVRNKNEDHELLIKTAQNLDALQKDYTESVEQSIRHDDMIRNDLEKLTSMFIDKEINDYRLSILNFSTDLSNGKKISRENYDYIFKVYEKYENILENIGQENGLVNESIHYIREKYHESLKDGEFNL